MSPEDVEYYVRYNESRDGPSRRIRINFDSSYSILLLNEIGLSAASKLPSLVGQPFKPTSCPAFPCDVWSIPSPNFSLDTSGHEETSSTKTKIQSWVVHYDGSALLIPTRSGPAASTSLPPSIGIIITGKENIVKGGIIKSVDLLEKNVPTPFITDKWGDSWNDNFYLEPRIVDSVPSTVFTAICAILEAGKSAFNACSYRIAAAKYNKAFHYCHSYFPETLDTADLQHFTELKIKSLLNLSLSGLKSGDHEHYRQCIEACEFLLGMPECLNASRAKAFYRRGRARLLLGDDELAKSDFANSLDIIDDPQTRAAMDACEKANEQRNAELKHKLRSAFT